MKRKDTQVYKDLIEKYCSCRSSVERYYKDHESNINKINRINKLIEGQENNPLLEFAINELKLIESADSCIKSSMYDGKFEEMKRSETILINDYNDNVDIIYSTYKIF